MSGIKRYNTTEKSVERCNLWVKYYDHLAAIKQARIDAVRELQKKLQNGAHKTLDGYMVWSEQIEYTANGFIKELSDDE